MFNTDTNTELINTYAVIRDSIEELMQRLGQYQKGYDKNNSQFKEYRYYVLRDSIQNNSVDKAARLIVLNKTCYNGLYRVNKDGEFNTPWGNYPRPVICDANNLSAVSFILKYLEPEIQCIDYRETLLKAGKNDFVYIDPPYDPKDETSNFTAYTSKGSGRESQIELADIFRKLSEDVYYYYLTQIRRLSENCMKDLVSTK
ncbi:MAG: Dam family site-specific DNA-(adenine-N6)-methyltransferase [Candidatus Nitrosopolaris sp.]